MTEVGSTYLGTEQGSFDCAEAGASQCLRMDTNRGDSCVALMAQSETANLSCPWMRKLEDWIGRKAKTALSQTRGKLNMKQG